MSLIFCPMYSGSSGNSLFLQAGNTRLLIDAGLSAKSIVSALDLLDVCPADLDGILITHEHSDHIRGAGAMSRKFNLPVYASEGTWQAMAAKLGDVASKNQRIFTANEDFYVRDIGVMPFSIPHDAADPVGFSLMYQGRKVSTATDLGHIQPQWMRAVAGSDILLLESNHDLRMLEAGRYPQYLKSRIRGRKGHLSNDDCGKALCALAASGVRTCILGHLSEENNLPELAYQTVRDALGTERIQCGVDFCLDIAWRDRIGNVYTIA